MSQGEVLTTIVVGFGVSGTDSGSLQFEGDPLRNLNTDGTVKTSFTEDDDYYFLVAYDRTKIRINDMRSSSGQVFKIKSAENQTREQVLDFIEVLSTDNKPSLSYAPAANPVVSRWVGYTGGAVSFDNTGLKADLLSGDTPRKCVISYPVTFDCYKLVPSRPINFYGDETSFEVLVAAYTEYI